MESLSRLIGQIYDAVIDPTLWMAVLAETCIVAALTVGALMPLVASVLHVATR